MAMAMAMIATQMVIAMAKTDKQSNGHDQDAQTAMAMAKTVKQSHGHCQDNQKDGHSHGQD